MPQASLGPVRWPRRDTLIPLALGALAFVVAFAQRPGLERRRHEGRPARGAGLVPARRRSARGRRAARSATSSPASTAATCGRWGRSSPSATSLGLPDWVVGAAVDRRRARARGVGHGAPARRARRPPARRRPPGRRPALHAQPVRRHLRGRARRSRCWPTAALPWLLLCVHRGLREPRGLVVAGGVRARADRDRGRRQRRRHRVGAARPGAARRSTSRAGARVAPGAAARLRWCGSLPVAAVASLWWVAAVLVHARYGLDFLPYTEQPGTIWSTTSLPESLRLLGFWTSYIGVGYSGVAARLPGRRRRYLLLAPVVAGDAAHPRARAWASFAWTRRARYAPFFLAARRSSACWSCSSASPRARRCAARATFTYNHVQAVQLPAHDLQGGAAGVARARGPRRAGRAAPLRAARCAAVALVGVGGRWSRARVLAAGARASAWTASSGCPTACPRRGATPPHDLDRTLPRGRRAMVLPGQLFAFYDWGGTYRPDPAGPDRPARWRRASSSRSPTCARSTCSGRPTRWSASSARVPGPAAAAARPHGRRRRRAAAPTTTARAAARSRPPSAAAVARRARPARRAPTGRRRTVPGAAGTLEPRRAAAAGAPLERAAPAAWCACCRATARRWSTARRPALADLAAFGALRDRPARCTTRADLDRAGAARRRPRAGRRSSSATPTAGASSSPRACAATRGWTAARRREALRGRARILDPFPRRGTDAQTVALVGGGRGSVRADFSPGFAAVPRAPPVRRARRRPVDRVAGRPRAGHRSPPPRRRLHGAARRRPRRPHALQRRPGSRAIAWRSNGREFAVHDGWNRLHARPARRALAERADRARRPSRRPARAAPAASASCASRACGRPRRCARRVLVEHALHGADLRRTGLTYLFDRTTGDDPAHPRVVTGARSRGLVRDQQDGERGWARAIAPPAARAWRADAWVSVAPETPDHVLDALDRERRDDDLRRLLALRGARAQPRLVGLRRRSGARVDRRMDPFAAARGFSGARGRRARSARCASSARRRACASRPACG